MAVKPRTVGTESSVWPVERRCTSSIVIKDAPNIRPKVLVHGTSEKDASLIAAGIVPMMKNSQRGHAGGLSACG